MVYLTIFCPTLIHSLSSSSSRYVIWWYVIIIVIITIDFQVLNVTIQIYPALARRGIKFTALKKITWGFGTAAASMIWAAVVQYYLYKTNPCGEYAATCTDAAGNALVSPLNVWIQTGS
jgi:hypothetical protein